MLQQHDPNLKDLLQEDRYNQNAHRLNRQHFAHRMYEESDRLNVHLYTPQPHALLR